MKIEDIKIISLLIKKRITNTISPAEDRVLNEWMDGNSFAMKYLSPDFLTSQDKEGDMEMGMEAYVRFEDKMAQQQKILQQRKKRNLLIRYSAAAVVMVGLFTATMLLIGENETGFVPHPDVVSQQIKLSSPTTVTNHGVISLEMADGSVLQIERTSGDIKVDGSTITIGEKKVDLVKVNSQQPKYNKLRIMRGAEHAMTLEDGTKVWINSESEFHFPTQFGATERRVIAKGEIYLDVAKDSDRPFIVETASGSVEVLGTIFNLRCYEGENMQTTLIEGSVKVSAGGENIVIEPGQQCNIEDGQLKVIEVELDEYTAWTKGLFTYNKRALSEIMLDVERTYDVKVVFEDKSLKGVLLTGTFKRYGDVNKVLEILKRTGGFKYQYDGQQIIIHK